MYLRLTLLIFLFLFTGFYNGSAQVFKNKDIQISVMQDHVSVIETSDMTTMYLNEGKVAIVNDADHIK